MPIVNKKMKSYIYELVELTPDMYFTLGFFTTLTKALEALEGKPTVDMDSELTEYEIRQHELNLVGHCNYSVCPLNKK